MKHWEKAVKRASESDKDRIAATILGLRQMRLPPDTKKLKGSDQCRTRVGDWRIFFHYKRDVLVIDSVTRRGDHTY